MHSLVENSLTYETIIKLGIAAALSLAIGIERELKRKPIGLKTSLVIATFSCLLTIISIQSVLNAKPIPGITVSTDPLRLAAQIVSGIGFLGAGVIFRRDNDSISGLTTAAMIWGSAGIGIAVGAGFYLQAIAAVILVLLGVEVIAPLFFKIGPKRLHTKDVSLLLHLKDANDIQNILKYLHNNNMEVDNIRIKDIRLSNNEIQHQVRLKFSGLSAKLDTLSLYNEIKKLPYTEEIEIEILP
ncbi:MgtC/SapB family protein [Rummeliibacillus suwonensis]|uniref:MgtC/SapB family protein n=1 Tax=Rummeliibacillus suwonensis TaxID=1306154 RepID=UPI0011B4574E|nr:MgtC/SapB family protein [Rummeliibacillus suwonensis]MBO2537492.1 MgtC/SapB family protein [Rummeliibacillus suwonensis]